MTRKTFGTTPKVVEILLATCNGGDFLSEQMESIRRQGYGNWRLIVGDDGSTDCTVRSIRKFARQDPGKIRFDGEDRHSRGVCGNFANLLELSTADYVMFCDQDDIWMPNKIEMFLREMEQLEKEHGKDMPLLVHSDLKVLRNGSIYESYWQYQKLNPHRGETLNRLLVQNTITGCATMINGPLRDLCCPIPDQAIMHDWWVGLVAAAFGKISRLSTPTVIYRQHERNAVGAKEWGWRFIRSRLSHPSQIRRSLLKTQVQATAFLERYRDRLSPEQYHLVRDYAEIDQRTFWGKRRTILRRGYLKSGLVRNVGLMTFI